MRSKSLRIIIICIAILLLICGLFYYLFRANIIPTPLFLNFIGNNIGAEIDTNESYRIIEKIKSSNQNNYKRLTLSDENDKISALIYADIPEKYVCEYEVAYSNTETESLINYKVIKDGERYRLEKYTGGFLSETVVSDGSFVEITDNRTGEKSVFPMSNGFPYESISGTTSLKSLIEILKNGEGNSPEGESPLGVVESIEYSLLRTALSNVAVITVIYDDETPSVRKEIYYIDIDRLVILIEENYSGNKLVHSVNTKSYSPDISKYDPVIFSIWTAT
jgi:hypothetical protein